ncbi:beta strand repeat-containing protein [Candidatus Methanomassiliicoccus intestinalis]|uniref:beta strand repeat-containing protein n=1 Tax=Candidatus Methanomassiliicoccus intestinalis TaxID=1406512 RepID=UPI0037DCA47A
MPKDFTPPTGSVFAGWSKTNPVGNTDVKLDYQVYDDIVSSADDVSELVDSNLDLYAVWVPNEVTVDGKTYYHTIYVSDSGKDKLDTTEGTSDTSNTEDPTLGLVETSPFKTLKKAYTSLDPNGTTTTNRIIIVGALSVSNESLYTDASNAVCATICGETKTGTGSETKSTLKFTAADASITINSDTVFENLLISNSSTAFIYAFGHNLTMGEGLTNSGDTYSDTTFGTPKGYVKLTIVGGAHNVNRSDIFNNQTAPDDPAIIKIISGEYGRVSGFGRSQENLTLDNINAWELHSKIEVYDAHIGTLAGGHIDSNAKGSSQIYIYNGSIANLVGGNVGNSKPSCFYGDSSISIFDGKIGNIYGAGLGRVRETVTSAPQTSIYGNVSLDMYGGDVVTSITKPNQSGDNIEIKTSGCVYAGGAASLFGIPSQIDKKICVCIRGGTIAGNLYGGGYGYSPYIPAAGQYNDLSSGAVYGSIEVYITGGTIGTYSSNNILTSGTGNVYGGGKGYYVTGSTNTSSAQVIGNIKVVISGGTLSDVFGGGEGILEYSEIAKVTGSTKVYIGAPINGDVYGGGEIGLIAGDTYVYVLSGEIGVGGSGGKVFGGGEGSSEYEYDLAGNVSGSTNILIVDSKVYGSVYGGGNYGYIGTKPEVTPSPSTPDPTLAGASSVSTNITISGAKTEIAGSVYGGGRGDENDINREYSGTETIYNSVVKGNVYGNTNVTINGGNIGYLSKPLPNVPQSGGWLDNEDAGNVFGGGKLGLVVGTTNVEISNGEIHRNVFGGGKGLSKSVFIELNGTEITSKLYNAIDSDHKTDLEENGLNFSVVKSYEWQGSTDSNSKFETISTSEEGPDTAEYNHINSSIAEGYTNIRLKVVVENDTIGTEDFYSNVIDITNASSNLTSVNWERYNRLMVQFGMVSQGTNVTISGTAFIHTNVYGGGSYGAVGVITGGIIENNDTYGFTHHIKEGTSNVTISGGKIGLESTAGYELHNITGGNVFGGGMGEPDLVTSGSIGESTEITISGGNINGNVYGGGENGFVGEVTINVSKDMSYITSAGNPTTTYCYGLSIQGTDNANGSTKINISSGTIGLSANTAEDHGNVFGGGKGANATVTHSTDVTVSNNVTIYGNVYGGGDFGCVGQFTGAQGRDASLKDGYTNVKITGGVMNSVYGGGRGSTEFNDIAKNKKEGTALTSTQLSKLIFGSVGASDPETVTSETADSTPNTNVKVTAGTINGNVYGGGELGLVSYLKVGSIYGGGRTSVVIGGANANEPTIEGSVYGGGQGVYTIDYSLFILGVVSSDTSVEVKNGIIQGSVYGGGMYGLVGTYHSNKDSDPSNADKLEFNGGPTKVTVSGGNIHTNVYGGGQGGINNLSGAVGKTEVNISGGYIGPQSTGYAKTDTPDFPETSVTPASPSVSVTSDSSLSGDSNFYSYIFVEKSITVGDIKCTLAAKTESGSILTLVTDDINVTGLESNWKDKYDAYRILSGNSVIVEFTAENGYHVTNWQISGVSADKATPTSLSFETPLGKKSTVVVDAKGVSNKYTVAVKIPIQSGQGKPGSIEVYNLNSGTPTPLDKNSGSDSYFEYYTLAYGTELAFKFVDANGGSIFYVAKWIVSPAYDLLQAENTSDVAMMTVSGNTAVYAILGPASGNVYGGGAYALVGDVTILLKGNRPVIDSPNNTQTVVNITGGEIGSSNAGSISTGNIYGGGYGPRAPVAGSTYINIGTVDSIAQSKDITIYGNVYGGGEMGSVGIPVHTYNDDDKDPDNYGNNVKYIDKVYGDGNTYNAKGNPTPAAEHTAKISTNISIKQEENHTITIGSDNDGNHLGNVFGGGQGGDLPQNVIDDLAIFDKTFPPLEGYAISYGISHLDISGTVTIHGSVYGGGEGLLKGQRSDLAALILLTNSEDNQETTFDSRSSISEKSIIASVRYGQVLGDVVGTPFTNTDEKEQISFDGNAAYVTIRSGVTVTDSVFGGGKLAILGGFEYTENGNEILGTFTGKATVVHISGNVNGNVFGGGEGHASGAVSGSVKDTLVIIDDKAEIGKHEEPPVTSPIGLPISSGNVYGGGSLSITGNFEFKNLWEMVGPNSTSDSTSDSKPKEHNYSKTNVIIAGGKVHGSVYGGGFSPVATIAGSTHVWIGDYSTEVTIPNLNKALEKNPISYGNIEIHGSVYGGGEMGSVGTTTLLNGTDENGQLLEDSVGHVSANVSVLYKNNAITIEGDVFGGGKGVLNVQVTIELHNETNVIERSVLGQAMVRGYTTVTIKGNDASTPNGVQINGSVFGGGKGVQNDAYALHYAKVYGYTVVNVSSATINGSVYGGGELGIIGQFIDKDVISKGDSATVGLIIRGTYYPNAVIKYADGNDADTNNGRYNIYADQDAVDNNAVPLESNILIISREYCSDDLSSNGTNFTTGKNTYYGRGTAAVTVKDSKISGSVYGGGKGLEINVLSGAVGRGTVVTIEDDPNNDLKTEIKGSVYGGGELGIVGSIITLIVGEGTSPLVKVTNISHVSDINKLTENPSDLDGLNDIDTVVNIRGGLIHGSVFGAGKGEECNYEFSRGSSGGDRAIAYYKLSVFGRTEVNISNGIIYKHVYGGSENGEVGSLTILKQIREFTTDYWAYASKTSGKIENGAPSDIPEEVRDNGYTVTAADGKETTVTANLSKFSSAFVNIVGGTIHGNVFGGGYFGAIHGNTHVHIGWNAMMPYDGGPLGDCHYYNDYDNPGSTDIKYGNRPLPFVERNLDGTVVYNEGSKDPKNAKTLAKDETVHDLFINGTVYAGGDRGDPSATTVSYDYISVYGTSHIILNGTGYNTGSDTAIFGEDDVISHAMYIRGSLFGSGNSCTTFYTDKSGSRFITINNYNAVDASNNFVIYSIQRSTEVTLNNSRIRLPGRSDGSNINTTALYSLNCINLFTLQKGELILETVANDLRGLRSVDSNGNVITKMPTDKDSPEQNIITLENGISLRVRAVTLDITDPANPTETYDFSNASVLGHFRLNTNSDYYGAYVFGSINSSGGFYILDTDGTLRPLVQEFVSIGGSTSPSSYSYWHLSGSYSAATTIVAYSNSATNESTVTLTLPVSSASSENTRFRLTGYSITSENKINLVDSSSDITDPNTDFVLKMSDPDQTFTGTSGLKMLSSPVLWSSEDIKFTLQYGNSISKSYTAGTVTLYIEEGTDESGTFMLKNRMEATITIKTQYYGIPSDVVSIPIDTSSETNTAEKNAELSPINQNQSSKTDVYFSSISYLKDGYILYDSLEHIIQAGNQTNGLVVKVVSTENSDNTDYWDGHTETITLTKDLFDNTKPVYFGTMDGRYNASLKFIVQTCNEFVIPEGELLQLNLKYSDGTSVPASQQRVLADGAGSPCITLTLLEETKYTDRIIFTLIFC